MPDPLYGFIIYFKILSNVIDFQSCPPALLLVEADTLQLAPVSTLHVFNQTP